ncbi:MAG: adenylyl-sulfate kinase [Planctomycetes bacterium]|nr:adenylyl-sulfate kinase [Planctomycetota bacterium]
MDAGRSQRRRLPVTFVGHVDHGKSTVIGRLLADTGRLAAGKMAAVRTLCEQTGKPFEYAFLLDALKDERTQGITIDAARCFFRGETRDYLFIDAPGHIEFLRNMISGAARAEAALLVIDAGEGVRENSRRHATLLGLLGIEHVIVLVNKMDLVGFERAAFEAIAGTFRAFLGELGLVGAAWIPVCARDGDNIARPSARTPWYAGPTVLGALEALEDRPGGEEGPLRLPVQDVYRFAAGGDRRRIVAGRVASGRLAVGDELLFLPSGKRSRVATIEVFHGEAPTVAAAGVSTGLTLAEQIYIRRGEIACHPDRPARVAGSIRASVFWMAHQPLEQGREYKMKLGCGETPVVVEAIERTLDAADLSVGGAADRLARHGVGDVVLRCRRSLALDVASQATETGRFVLVDSYEIAGGGIVREVLEDAIDAYRRAARVRELKWIAGGLDAAARRVRYGHGPALVMITGPVDSGRKDLARDLERRLFEAGRHVYYLAIGSVVHGVDLDLTGDPAHAEEHLRRFGEVAHLLLDTGLIVVATARDLGRRDLESVAALVEPDPVVTVGLGAGYAGDPFVQVPLAAYPPHAEAHARILAALENAGVIPRS